MGEPSIFDTEAKALVVELYAQAKEAGTHLEGLASEPDLFLPIIAAKLRSAFRAGMTAQEIGEVAKAEAEAVIISGTFAEREEQVNALARREVPGVKAEPAPAFMGKPTWRGCYFVEGWHTVVNQGGEPIAYASEDAALAGAKVERARVLAS